MARRLCTRWTSSLASCSVMRSLLLGRTSRYSSGSVVVSDVAVMAWRQWRNGILTFFIFNLVVDGSLGREGALVCWGGVSSPQSRSKGYVET